VRFGRASGEGRSARARRNASRCLLLREGRNADSMVSARRVVVQRDALRDHRNNRAGHQRSCSKNNKKERGRNTTKGNGYAPKRSRSSISMGRRTNGTCSPGQARGGSLAQSGRARRAGARAQRRRGGGAPWKLPRAHGNQPSARFVRLRIPDFRLDISRRAGVAYLRPRFFLSRRQYLVYFRAPGGPRRLSLEEVSKCERSDRIATGIEWRVEGLGS
jgi:hypothetical protein